MMLKLQPPAVVQPVGPMNVVKVELASAAAARVTVLPELNEPEQVPVVLPPLTALQEMPEPLMLPPPLTSPAAVELSCTFKETCRVNAAVTFVLSVRVTVQLPVPEQPPPDQPLKIEPLSAVAVRVTSEEVGKYAVQLAPQLMPVGVEVTVPLPVPVLVTASAF